ncbi:hypothetical protein JVU11DRAFT_3813 [Chiua virens]|nr:hypothetical protein JVU11DRAFT_3813 [Chiua virens]
MSWLKAKDWATGVEYSKLFHSGLRAISLRPCAHRAGAHSSSLSSWENILSGGTTVESLSSRSLEQSTETGQPSSRQFMQLGSRPTPPPRAPEVSCPRPPSMFAQSTKETTDAWSPRGIFIEIGDYLELLERRPVGYLMLPIEMEAALSLAGSRPLDMNLSDTDDIIVTPAMEDESFLSLSGPHDLLPPYPPPRDLRPLFLPSRRHRTGGERGDGARMSK